MAIVKGRRLYSGSDKMAALAAEDDRAVAEYAYLMAGISDDWGRFKISPRKILGEAYENRPQVNELLVADWLAMFEKHGLLKLYTSEGMTYGEWTNYMGHAESQRKNHACPEPPWSTHRHTKNCRYWRESKSGVPLRGRPKGKPKGYPQGQDLRSTYVTDGTYETESLPNGRGESADAPQVVTSTPKPWTVQAGEAYEIVNGAGQWIKTLAIRFNKCCGPLVKAYGPERVLTAWKWFLRRTDEKPAFLTPEQFASSFLRWEERMGGSPSAGRVTPAAQARQDAANALIRGGLIDERGMGPGNGGASGEPARPRLVAGDAVGSGPDDAEGAGPVDR